MKVKELVRELEHYEDDQEVEIETVCCGCKAKDIKVTDYEDIVIIEGSDE